ncbi:Esterase FE4 [Eumeta japonica]|uniref:Esterase FE4 n=1 Tax=Eumeta variegata TaxID=151549 RepID=A0A4C1V0V7_EUMVA|nr:Esterase FE4 [Eumeta japonica]
MLLDEIQTRSYGDYKCESLKEQDRDQDQELAQGVVRGHKHATRDIYEFHGIPYATAPTGRDKFKEATPAPRWEGIFDATESRIACPQAAAFELEDCLIINVFVPGNNEDLKPVVVYIHGGAFVLGFGNMGLPYHLVEKDIVAVTFNYRLGVHGFLCLGTESVPGNAGLKDQLIALRWVKNNIEAFGGNPDDITLAGYSAGAASAELLMLSSTTNGLFHKVILESGSAIASWSVNPRALELAQRVAVENGANNVDNITLLEDFYLSLSYQELVSIVPSMDLLFAPCIDNVEVSQQVIVEKLPYEILQAGNYTKLPLLTGYTDAEGLLFYDSREKIMADMNDNFQNALPPNFSSYGAINEEEASQLIRNFYFDEDIVTYDLIRNFTDYLTDSQFSFWIVESAKQHALNAPVYLYEYTYVSSLEELTGRGLGADHCSQTDIILEILTSSEDYSDNDLIVQRRVVDMWANFILFGEPILSGNSALWEPLDVEKMNFLVIDLNIGNDHFPSRERLRFWDKIWLGRSEPVSPCLLSAFGDEILDVTLPQGVVRGHKHATLDIYEFHGIHYATEPTGRDKFKAPLPAPTWEGVFDAVEDFITCPQPPSFQSEQCLRVNVFVPGSRQEGTLKSVFVIIHGGAFVNGFGNGLLPHHVVERDVMVVTFNYRLGPHGFLCLNTENIPGNAGLKDQLAALKWVKQNIQAFGGDPDDITLGGYSAGAASAEIMMLSPAADGLFHKVILESGSGIGSWAVNPNGPEFAKNIAIANGASDVDAITNLENFYLSLSYQELLSLVSPGQLLFTPCVDIDIDNNEVIVKELPYKNLVSGNYNKLPLLTGYTDAEGLLFYGSRETLMAQMNEDFKNTLPPNFDSYAAINDEEAVEMLKDFYFDVEVIDYDSIRNFTDYYTDGQFSYWVVESARQNALNSAPVYLYEYTYVTSEAELTGPGLGATHCAHTELIFISFRTSENYTERDLIVQDRLVTMWSNFVKFGEPVPQGSADYWEPLDAERMNYLVIGFELENKTFPTPERVVRGHKHDSRDLYEFLGIPYAVAPTGRDKFKEPLSAPNLEGVFDAVEKMTMCPQAGSFQTEDCLKINVFVPGNRDGHKSVVVYIHGGAFAVGFGNMMLPYTLVERDIIAVTFNYRLGAHGFLCLNTETAPGNAGLKDQLAALKWVKQNIEAFGGNPEDITVAGYSAGASSAELLMLSPAAEGLFHKVILESASAITSMGLNPNALEFAMKVAEQNGVNNVENVTHLEEFYLSLSYQELTTLVPPLDLSSLFCPCIEVSEGNDNAIVTELPYNILIKGNYPILPLLTGYTDAEGLFLYDAREALMAQMNEDFTNTLPPNFSSYSELDEEEAAELIRSFYFDVDVITYGDIRNFTDYYTDSLFSYWVIESAKQNALHSAPVYLYEYTYVTSEEEVSGPGLGADHCAQTMIILESISSPANYSENDLIVQNRLVNMWSNFIKYGVPVPQGDSDYWEPLDPERMNHLVIDLNLENKSFPKPERVQFWDKIWFGRNGSGATHNFYFYTYLLAFTFTFMFT